jgi:hypothetical protein
MSPTMPNALHGMYLLIIALRGKCSRSIGTKQMQGQILNMAIWF